MAPKPIIYVIAGPDHNGNFLKSNFKALIDLDGQYDVRFFGNGKDDIDTEKMLAEIRSDDPNAEKNFVIVSHGNIYAGKHHITVGNTGDSSKDFLATEEIFSASGSTKAKVNVFSDACYSAALMQEAHINLKKNDVLVTTSGYDVSYNGGAHGIDFRKYVNHVKSSGEEVSAEGMLKFHLTKSNPLVGSIITYPGVGSKQLEEYNPANNEIVTPAYGQKQFLAINNNINISVEESYKLNSLYKNIKDGNLEGVKGIIESGQIDKSINYITNSSIKSSNLNLFQFAQKTSSKDIIEYLDQKNMLLPQSSDKSYAMNIYIALNSSDTKMDKAHFISVLEKGDYYKRFGFSSEKAFFSEMKSMYVENDPDVLKSLNKAIIGNSPKLGMSESESKDPMKRTVKEALATMGTNLNFSMPSDFKNVGSYNLPPSSKEIT